MLERLGTLLVVQLCVGVGAAARDARHELDHHAPRAEDGEEERGDEQGRGVGGAERQLLEGGERDGDLLVHDEGGEASGDEEQEQRREEVGRCARRRPRPPLEAATADGGKRREGEDEREEAQRAPAGELPARVGLQRHADDDHEAEEDGVQQEHTPGERWVFGSE